MANPVEALRPLIDGARLQDHEDSYVLEVKIDDPSEDEISSIAAMGRLRVASLYFHALETLVRLYLAHLPGVPLPWFAISREVDFRKFKKKVAKLSKISEDPSITDDVDDSVQDVFRPAAEPTDEQAAAIRRARIGCVMQPPSY